MSSQTAAVEGFDNEDEKQTFNQVVHWENFPGYLIDHCEGSVISEEGLQHALAAMIKDPQYNPVECEAPGSALNLATHLPQDFLTHRGSWRRALLRLIELEPATQAPDTDQKGFWQHELNALDNAYRELDDAMRGGWVDWNVKKPRYRELCLVETSMGYFVGNYESLPSPRWIDNKAGRWVFEGGAKWLAIGGTRPGARSVKGVAEGFKF